MRSKGRGGKAMSELRGVKETSDVGSKARHGEGESIMKKAFRV